jgi:hypothetical protein
MALVILAQITETASKKHSLVRSKSLIISFWMLKWFDFWCAVHTIPTFSCLAIF